MICYLLRRLNAVLDHIAAETEAHIDACAESYKVR